MSQRASAACPRTTMLRSTAPGIAENTRSAVVSQPLERRQEQEVVVDTEPQPAAARQSGERLAARSFQPEWLLDEGVPPRFEDAARRLEMLIGRQQHMDRVELGVEQLLESGKA